MARMRFILSLFSVFFIAFVKVLKQFLGDSELDVFEAVQARDIKKFFRFVTMSVSQRAKSVNPNQPVSLSFDDSDENLDDFEF